MAILPNQILNTYYREYGNKEIAFNKSILRITGLEPKKIFIKVKGEYWPCVLYSCSMKNAKIIINLDKNAFDEIKNANNYVSLRLSFFPKTVKNSINFFIPSVIKGYNTFKLKDKSSFLVNLDFSQRPPDDLIEILGNIFESIENFEKRKELRIPVEPKVIDDIGLKSNKIIIAIEQIKRPCILRNMSSSGCLCILVCNPKFIINKPTEVFLQANLIDEPIVLSGQVVRHDQVMGRKDMYGIGIAYDMEKIPYEYKELINNYLTKLENMAKHKKINGK